MDNPEKKHIKSTSKNLLEKYQRQPSYFRFIIPIKKSSNLGKIRVFCIFVLILILLPLLIHFYNEFEVFELKIPQITLEEGLNKEILRSFVQNLTGSIIEDIAWKGEKIPNEKKKLAEKAEKMEQIVQLKEKEIEGINLFFFLNIFI
jgi:hypothetical protein